MEIIKKGFIVLFISGTILNANILDDIKSGLDGTSVEITDAGYYKTQIGGMYTLGGARVRFDGLGKVYPFHAQAPSMSVGCNGIDITFGAFSYLNFDYLVDKLKKISAAAPAFAFQAAMRTMCPQCATIMQNLEKIVNSINNLNFDTCKIAQDLGNWGGNKMGEVMNTNLGTGQADSFMGVRMDSINNATKGITDFFNGVNDFFNGTGKDAAKLKMGYGSAIKNAMERYTASFSNVEKDEFQALMTALIGDIYGYTDKKTASDGSDQTNPNVLLVLEPTVDIDKMYKWLLYGNDNGKIKLKYIEEQKDGDLYIAPNTKEKELDFSSSKSLFNNYKSRINGLIEKIKNKEKITSSDLSFINSSPIPLYRIINIQATIGADSDITNKVSEYLAVETIYQYLRYFTNQISHTFASMMSQPDWAANINTKKRNGIKNMIKRANLLQSKLLLKRNEIMKNIKTQDNLLSYYQNLEKQMMQQNPIWKASKLGI